MTATAGRPLPDGSRVFRVVKTQDQFFVPPEFREPRWRVYKPTDDDLAHEPVGVSAFDAARATFNQAVAIREAQGQPLGRVQRVEVGVGQVREVGTQTGHPLDVIEDPLLDVDLPGADGHVLITGLEQKPGEATPVWKNRLSALARLATAA